MKATIAHFNSRLGYYSAITETRKRLIFELVEPSILNIDDVLEGSWEGVGLKIVTRGASERKITIDIKEIHSIDKPFQGHSGKEPNP